jgi:hypothetical protein
VYFVVVTTKAGDHVLLGAPVSRTMGDPGFTRQFGQIRQSWQDATGIIGTPETAAPTTWPAGTVWLAAAIGVQLVALAVIFGTVPYSFPRGRRTRARARRGCSSRASATARSTAAAGRHFHHIGQR